MILNKTNSIFYYLITILLILVSNNIHAQLESISCLEQIQQEEIPKISLNVRFHFKGINQANNFFNGDLSDPSLLNGNFVANEFINEINSFLSNVSNASPTSINPFYGDTRIRFEIFPDISNGVRFIYDEFGVDTEPDVIDIIIEDNGDNNEISGSFVKTSKVISLNNWFKNVNLENQSFTTQYRKEFLHQFGHLIGLRDSYSCQNECEGVDIDPNLECGSDCSENIEDCPSLEVSSNFMGENETRDAITYCQWNNLYGELYKTKPLYSNFASCNLEPSQDYIIEYEDEVWNSIVNMNRNVIIKTGRTLTINCLLNLYNDNVVIVERGAKLIIEDGGIVNSCPEEKWGGIFVEGNSTIPQPDPFSGLTNPDQSGILIINNGFLHGAKNAISTSKFGEHWNSEFWGGVINAMNSDFIDNNRSVEIMKYDFPSNNSGYSGIPNECNFENCRFIDERIGGDRVGVTIWGAYDIEFKRCEFKGYGNAAILGIDFSVNISERNSFIENDKGVEIYSTFPVPNLLSQIGKIGNLNDNKSNTFIGNSYPISINSNNEIAGVDIIENQFFPSNGFSTVVSIVVFGNSTYRIFNNYFAHVNRGIQVNETGLIDSEINCNLFEDIEFFNSDISILGDNLGLRLLHNNFTNFFNRPNIVINSFGENEGNGRIAPNQGFFGIPAKNCFSTEVGIKRQWDKLSHSIISLKIL